MQSDTVIGIVGAVVLVAVMVGVFAYEYNNAPEDAGPEGPDPESVAGRMAAFNATYPSLAAEDDIDNDDTPNWEDDDIDDDGVDDAEDTEFDPSIDVSGTVPAQSGQSASTASSTFSIGEGHAGGTLTVSYSVTANPLGGAADPMVVELVDPEGTATQCDETVSGGTATCTLDISDAALTGEWTVRVTGSAVTPQARDYSGTVDMLYPLTA